MKIRGERKRKKEKKKRESKREKKKKIPSNNCDAMNAISSESDVDWWP